MLEGLIAVAELIGHLIGALAELAFEFVRVALELCGLGVEHLVRRSEKGQSEFSTKRVLIAVAPLALVMIATAGLLGYQWHLHRIARKQSQTEELLQRQVAHVVAAARGHELPRAIDAVRKQRDAWTNPLQVTIQKTILHRRIIVRSAGADGEFGTADDLSASGKLPRKEAADQA